VKYKDASSRNSEAAKGKDIESGLPDGEEASNPEILAGVVQSLDVFSSELSEYELSCTRLSKLTAQQVELEMENQGKAILVFTIVTLIFLPLSFVTSFLGMNVSDIRTMERGQSVFWIAGLSLTALVVSLSFLAAFYSEQIRKTFEVGLPFVSRILTPFVLFPWLWEYLDRQTP